LLKREPPLIVRGQERNDECRGGARLDGRLADLGLLGLVFAFLVHVVDVVWTDE